MIDFYIIIRRDRANLHANSIQAQKWMDKNMQKSSPTDYTISIAYDAVNELEETLTRAGFNVVVR